MLRVNDFEKKYIRVSHYERSTRVLGPGNRFAVWFQGCEKNCLGCINPEGRNRSGGYEIEVEKLFKIIVTTPNIQGVTISGGEPFLQFSGLKELIYLIKAYTQLDIMVFSGYTYNDIRNKYADRKIQKFFSLIDIFVDGEYVEALNDNQMFRGSSNQNIYFFTKKYIKYKDQILHAKNRDIEFSIDDQSNVFMIGIPPKNFYEEFISDIAKVRDNDL